MEMELKRKIAEGTECTQWQVIKLTDEEIEQVYRARRLYYNMEDIRHKLDGYLEEYEDEDDDEEVHIKYGVDVPLKVLRRVAHDDEWIKSTAEDFDNALSENDSFMESFWMTAEEVIGDCLEGEEE